MNTGILDSGKIECFLWSRVLGLATLPSIRETVEVFFGSLYRSQVSMDTKACILRRVVIPLISEGICPGKSFGVAAASQAPCKAVPSCRSSEIDARAEKLLKGPILEYMHSNIWVAFSTSESYKPGHDDYLRLQFISLSFILLRKAPHLVGDMRKDMIRFGWTCVRHDNPVVKNAAYVLLAQFIAAFETPRKIVIQVLLHLLRAHQPEYRPMVRQALEILVPSLTIRLATGAPSAELPIWVKWFNRVLFEHGHTVGQIVHIHQLITHLSDVFYPYREQLAPKLVNSLTKLCLTQNATLETRTLALDIIEMLLDWDIQHIKTVVSHSERFESTPLSQLRQEMANTIITKQRRETVVGILLRILCLAYDFVAKSGLAKRLKELLNKYLDKDSWPPMHLRLTFFERALSMPDTKPERMPFFEHILQTLDLVSMNMQQSWIVENFAILANTSIKFLKTESPVVHELIARQLSRLYQAMGASETLYDSHTTTNFRQQVQTHILENLQSGSNLHGVLRILDAIGKYQGEQFYDYIPLLVKLLQKHAREYVAQSSSQGAASGGTAAVPSGGQPHSLATTVNQGSAELDEATILRMVRTVPSTSEIKGSTQRDILLLLMVILHNHLMQLGDQRRGYLATLIQLVERVNDPHVLVTILSMVYNWVLRSPDPFPTIKEKATIMAAMICFATDPQANPKWSPITSTVQAPSPADGNGGATRSGQAFTAYQIMSKEYLSL
ncbi:transcription-associated protein 1, partial [Spiromyces aspiralis]